MTVPPNPGIGTSSVQAKGVQILVINNCYLLFQGAVSPRKPLDYKLSEAVPTQLGSEGENLLLVSWVES